MVAYCLQFRLCKMACEGENATISADKRGLSAEIVPTGQSWTMDRTGNLGTNLMMSPEDEATTAN